MPVRNGRRSSSFLSMRRGPSAPRPVPTTPGRGRTRPRCPKRRDTSILVCIFFLYKMLMPFWLLAMLIGACVALVIALCVNFAWKISAHAIGIGGLLGAIMGVARIHMINPYWAFIVVLIVAGLLGTSRIFLKRHTPMQVYAGFCLGFICTFVASLMSYIYLFI